MVQKYVVRDFHPLVLFYALGFLLFAVSVPLLARFVFMYLAYDLTPRVNLISFVFTSTMAAQFTLFAMWFDMESNRSISTKLDQYAIEKDRKSAENYKTGYQPKVTSKPANEETTAPTTH